MSFLAEVSSLAADGDAAAEDFLRVYLAWAQCVDDCVDRDKPVDAPLLAGVSVAYLETLARNPFVARHRPVLVGSTVPGMTACAASMEPGCPAPQVLKSVYQEVVYVVALLSGGWDHHQRVARAARRYDTEPPPFWLPPAGPARDRQAHAQIIAQACLGNEHAAQFCTAWIDYCHFIDDSVDQDKAYSAHPVDVVIRVTTAFGANPFFLAHAERFLGIVSRAAGAWVDSEQTGDGTLKGAYHEVVWEAANLVGGWDHASRVTAVYRKYKQP